MGGDNDFFSISIEKRSSLTALLIRGRLELAGVLKRFLTGDSGSEKKNMSFCDSGVESLSEWSSLRLGCFRAFSSLSALKSLCRWFSSPGDEAALPSSSSNIAWSPAVRGAGTDFEKYFGTGNDPGAGEW